MEVVNKINSSKMKIKNAVIVAGLIILTALVLFKSFNHNGFRNDARKWAAGSAEMSNIVLRVSIDSLPGDKLLVNLNDQTALNGYNVVNIPAEKILDNENIRKLLKYPGNIILVSQDSALSARIWMLLSQMGIKKLYILAG
jgi:hypothetical protein